MSYCCFLLLPGLYQPAPPPSSSECFQPKLPFLSWSVSSDVQFSPKSLWLTWSMSVSWDATAPLSCDEYIFLKITPIVWIMSLIVILNFCCWWWWLYIFFSSVQQCTVMTTILFYCRISFLWLFFLCSTCCTETFQRKSNCPFQLISSGPYLFFPCKSSCYRKSPWNHSLP